MLTTLEEYWNKYAANGRALEPFNYSTCRRIPEAEHNFMAIEFFIYTIELSFNSSSLLVGS